VMKQYGADILRLWVVASDYAEDLRIGPEILKHHGEAYRRLRNTLRFLLGGLAGYAQAEALPDREMPELERWILHRLAELDALVRRCADEFDFHDMFTALHNFCAVDLSAFWFDVRKDALYCEAPDSTLRRAVRTVMDRVFDALVRWLAPMICFTAEEAWIARHGDGAEASVHLETYASVPRSWRDDALGAKWAKLRDIRRVVTGAIELERAQKRLGASLQADAQLYVDPAHLPALEGVDLAEICITSSGSVHVGDPSQGAFVLADVPGAGAVIGVAAGEKCQRCWKILPEVGSVAGHPDLCRRCADVVERVAANA
jgi:isoleucyl-tRNA synthetase